MVSLISSLRVQDFFESRVISMDTDFRMFSAAHLGSLPGVDLATVLDGAPALCRTASRVCIGTAMLHLGCAWFWALAVQTRRSACKCSPSLQLCRKHIRGKLASHKNGAKIF